MPTLKEKMDEMARIKSELQKMEDDESITEETDGDLRDTLVARWEELDGESKPIIERMERIRGITRTAADPGNLERPPGQDNGDGGYGARKWNSPDLVVRTNRDPYEGVAAVRLPDNHLLMQRSEIRERALDAVELEAKRGNLGHDFAEEVTRKAQLDKGVGEHVLLTGGQEYQEAFRAYLADPQGEAQRTALSLSLANGGYLLPFVLDHAVA
jgi:hypothetical protein